MMRYKVLLTNVLYLPNVGGVENYLRSLATILTRQGHSVDIVCSDRVVDEVVVPPTIEVRHEARVSRYSYGRGLLGYIRQLRDARRLTRTRNSAVGGFDCAVARSHHAVLYCRLAGIKSVIYVVPAIYANQYAHRRRSGLLKDWFGYSGNVALQRLAFALSEDTVVLSRTMLEQVERFARGNVKPRLIPPGVDVERFHLRAAHEQADLRRQLGFPEDRRIILALGRFAPVKGFEYAIEALVYLPKDHHLVLVGEGPLESSYRDLAARMGVADRVQIFPGTLMPEDFFGAADVFVLPSTHEPFGQVLLEATASGLPVAAFSAAAGVSTATEEVYGGFKRLAAFCPACSPCALAAAIFEAREHIEEHELEFVRERGRFLETYSWDKVARELLSVGDGGGAVGC